ncbi:MAG: hypothetical protein HYY24_28660 [Verrucomicrobia bacterium]|nr:hypothetical protein [Verrucomicrobiota bacterium]
MSAPLDFLKIFAGQLRGAGIPFAITSGMACVHYGLQQITKDSDWIIPAEALERLRALLSKLEGDLPPWRVSYRQIFGAPLEADFMQHGWTSHLSIWDGAASVEHKVDIFSKPPRVKAEEIQADSDGWATRHVVAQMKRTDRDKDWPILQGLGQQLWERNNALCLLHLTEPGALLAAWRASPSEVRARMAARRPLLRALDAAPPPARLDIERLLALERLVWERVNEQRHSRYTRAWKNFYRQWRREEDWEWPTSEQFWLQHRRLVEAVHRHALPAKPLANVPPEQLVEAALREVAKLGGAAENEIAQVLPPVDELLP